MSEQAPQASPSAASKAKGLKIVLAIVTVVVIFTVFLAIRGGPPAAKGPLDLAKERYDQGKYKEAGERYDQFLTADEGSQPRPVIYLLIGKCLALEGKPQEAVNHLDAFAKSKHYDKAYAANVALARARALEGVDKAKAIRALRELIDQHAADEDIVKKAKDRLSQLR